MSAYRAKSNGESVDGLVLSGGAGRRLGGVDKGLLPYAGQTSAARALDLLRPHCRELWICANRNLAEYRALGAQHLLSDLRPDFPGPLGGLEAVAEHIQTDLLLILPCDLPLLDAAVPGELLQALRSQPTRDVVYARAGAKDHYLCAALRCRCLSEVSGELDAGRHAVQSWYKSLDSSHIDFDGEAAASFDNFNRPTDWSRDTAGTR
ncbi:MAG: molybdopterin-guanine dinucleotide biosynthesis protein A [Halieaceae bacterium]|jgi:molybdopterin-guanine dinucleotide biosynthesis protein A